MLRLLQLLGTSARVARILSGAALLAFASGVHAEEDVRAPRPVEIWLETLVQAARTYDVKWDSILLAPPPKSDAPQHTARVEITSTERFSRLSRLLDFRAGTAEMKDLSSAATKRRQVIYEVNVTPRTPSRSEEAPAPISDGIQKIYARLTANPNVTIQRMLLLRPLEVRVGNHDRLQVPVDLRLTGEIAQLLTLVHELPRACPCLTPVSLRIERDGGRGTLDARFRLLAHALPEANSVPDQKTAHDQISHQLVAFPSVQLTVNSASVGWQVQVTGPLGATANAGPFLVSALSSPGLASFDVLGFQHGASTSVSGLLFLKGH